MDLVRKLGYNFTVKKCSRCGGSLRRIHRTFWERLSYMAKYKCRECQTTETVPRPFKFHFGARCRCHRCGSYRITKLRVRDKIDPMEAGLLNLCERVAGGNLYHCKFCRIQFYDRRKFIPQNNAAAVGAQPPPEAPAVPPPAAVKAKQAPADRKEEKD